MKTMRLVLDAPEVESFAVAGAAAGRSLFRSCDTRPAWCPCAP